MTFYVLAGTILVMKTIKTIMVKQLLMDLRFGPEEQRINQLNCAESLYHLVNVEQMYPFEFVCFQITGYRPRENAEELIGGADLESDLRNFIMILSSDLSLAANSDVLTYNDIAKKFDVSIRTVERWRKKGLIARRYVFGDGVKKIGFEQSSLNKFIEKNPQLVAKAGSFKRLGKNEKDGVLKLAKRLAREDELSRADVINHIAGESGRARDTIRRVLIEAENSGGPLFERKAGLLDGKVQKEIFQMFADGVSVEDLAKQFGRGRSTIYRIVNKRRLRGLKKIEIDFIDSEEFVEDGAEDRILAKGLNLNSAGLTDDILESHITPGQLSSYIETVKTISVLKRESEVELFRRYNYLKYLASVERAKISSAVDISRGINKVEAYLGRAQRIRKVLIETSLRLVITIANRHSGRGENMADLISEGNIALMRAVEKFDYGRGFRFATYASWAITKEFARIIPAEAMRPDRAGQMDIDGLPGDMRRHSMPEIESAERAHYGLEDVIANNLTDREQYIIKNHFGLTNPGSLRREHKSLQKIGDDIGLSKERIRQIELIALQKLRQCLSEQEFELLMET